MIVRFSRHGADDNSPYAQEPDDAKVSCPVLYRRWGGQPPHRPELARLLLNDNIYFLFRLANNDFNTA